jgi:spermidine synthase
MELWYSRSASPGANLCIKVRRPLLSHEGSRGRIDVLETEDFGRLLAENGEILVTEADGFAQREMLAHVPLFAHPCPRSVLVAGGSECGVAAEALRHERLERLVVVEEDEVLAEAASRFFPETAIADPRANTVKDEVASFVRDSHERFDLIIASARVGSILDQAFFCDCFRLLAGDGILVMPCGSAFFPGRRLELLRAVGKLKRLFPIFRLYRVERPSADGGSILIGFASKRQDPVRDFDPSRWESAGISTRYYNAEVHVGAFALPEYVREALTGA